MRPKDLARLPAGLPAPVDDRAADHLHGAPIPSVRLESTQGGRIDLSTVRGLVAVFAFPRTGRPNEESLVPDWDLIPGARGCTPHTCGFRDRTTEFAARDCRIFGLSTQDGAYQREMVERLHVPFPVLSDEGLELTRALNLPTFTVAGHTLLKRLSWFARDGRIEKVFYPVFPPDKNAEIMLAWLG